MANVDQCLSINPHRTSRRKLQLQIGLLIMKKEAQFEVTMLPESESTRVISTYRRAGVGVCGSARHSSVLEN
jgi:hypothetical protein